MIGFRRGAFFGFFLCGDAGLRALGRAFDVRFMEGC